MFKIYDRKYYVAITRFNNTTYAENLNYRISKKYDGCVYGTPRKVKESIPENSVMFVMEMNNTLNQIMGIGVIRNKANRPINIYKKHSYNTYVYNSPIRKDFINNEQMNNFVWARFKKDMERLVFFGSDHVKRGFGIQLLPQKKFLKNHNYIRRMIVRLFGDCINSFSPISTRKLTPKMRVLVSKKTNKRTKKVKVITND